MEDLAVKTRLRRGTALALLLAGGLAAGLAARETPVDKPAPEAIGCAMAKAHPKQAREMLESA